MYSIDEDAGQDEVPLPTCDDNFYLNFGTNNRLGEPVSVSLKVVNTSAIPTCLETVISNFPAAKVSNLPQQGTYYAPGTKHT